MHRGNEEWLADLGSRYYLGRSRLLELGSLNYNGSARDFLDVREWVGVDQYDGAGVDIVGRAIDTRFRRCEFDVLLCTSMLEHDPDWRWSLGHNLAWLRPSGLIFLSWGAEGNQHHLPEPWKPVRVIDVWAWVTGQQLIVREEYWEGERYTADCLGCYNMVLQKPL